MNTNVYIKENIKDIDSKGNSIYIAPDIPDKKMDNALKAFKYDESLKNYILAIYDDTTFGSVKEGIIFTGKKFIHSKDGSITEFAYEDLISVIYVKERAKSSGVSSDDILTAVVPIAGLAKKALSNNYVEYVRLTMKNSEQDFVVNSSSFNYKHFAEILNNIIENTTEYNEEDQLKAISDMPEELKEAYLQILVNMAYKNNNQIDDKEFSEILLLMTRLVLSKESRFNIRIYITEISDDNIMSVNNLIEVIKENAEASHMKSLMISLVKDIININFSTTDSREKDIPFLLENNNLFNLSDNEMDLVYSAVKNDYDMIEKDLDDNKIKKNAEDLAAKAAAAGAPLAAVYISGSVAGMSAAGITSGLATLGMGMGMTGGLVVVGLIGIATYQGLKHLTNANELDKYKIRELMLHAIIQQTQKTISSVIDDINYLVQKLNDVTLNHMEQVEKIKKLVHMMAKYQNAIKAVDRKTDHYQNIANRLHCPQKLDIHRLKSLTDEPTKKVLFTFILDNYEEKTIETNGKEEKVMVLQEDIDTEILEKIGEIFKSLGYFDMDNILKSKSTEGLNKIKGMF